MTFNESSPVTPETSFEPTTKEDLSALQEQVERPDPIEKYGVLIVESENHPEYLQYLKQKEAYEEACLKWDKMMIETMLSKQEEIDDYNLSNGWGIDLEDPERLTEEKYFEWHWYYPQQTEALEKDIERNGDLQYLENWTPASWWISWMTLEASLKEIIWRWDNAWKDYLWDFEVNTNSILSEEEQKKQYELEINSAISSAEEAKKLIEYDKAWVKARWVRAGHNLGYFCMVHPPEKVVLVKTPDVEKQIILLDNWYKITLDGWRSDSNQKHLDDHLAKTWKTYQEIIEQQE